MIFKQGILNYFCNIANYFQLFYLLASISQSIFHLILGPFEPLSKLIMVFVIALTIKRTFSFMRIFQDYSPIVTMLFSVIYDLRIFLLFYFIMICMFSLVISTLGLGNKKLGVFKEFYDEGIKEEGEAFEYPGIEFEQISYMISSII